MNSTWHGTAKTNTRVRQVPAFQNLHWGEKANIENRAETVAKLEQSGTVECAGQEEGGDGRRL